MRCVSEQERAIWQFVNLSADPQARTKFMINNRTGAWKTDVNFLILANHGETANFSRKAVFFVTAKTIWTHLYIAWIPEVVSYCINLVIREPSLCWGLCWGSICFFTLKSVRAIHSRIGSKWAAINTSCRLSEKSFGLIQYPLATSSLARPLRDLIQLPLRGLTYSTLKFMRSNGKSTHHPSAFTRDR